MKDQIQELIIQFIQMVQTGFDFVQAEHPIFIQEVLTFWTTQAWVSFGIILLLTIICVVAGIKLINLHSKVKNYKDIEDVKLRRKYHDYFCSDYEGYFLFLGYSLLFFAGIFLLVFLLHSVPTVLKATFAPRLFLLENLKSLL